MIETLSILLLIALLLAWVTLMRIWWKKEHGDEEPLTLETITNYGALCARLTRRGWYRITFYFERFTVWGNKKIARVFFMIFPNAAPAFEKKDELAGFKHGPSSFFLKSISEKPKRSPRKRV